MNLPSLLQSACNVTDSVLVFHTQLSALMRVMLLQTVLLSPCFPILLHVDMVIALEGMDGLVGKLNPVNG